VDVRAIGIKICRNRRSREHDVDSNGAVGTSQNLEWANVSLKSQQTAVRALR
jgi:hypothetical protein